MPWLFRTALEERVAAILKNGYFLNYAFLFSICLSFLLYTTYFTLTLLCFKLNLFSPTTPFYVWISTQWEVNF